MSIITTIVNQKSHIIYGVIILIVASVAYHFFKKDPEKIVTTLTKTVTQVQTVDKIVNKDRIVYVDKTITTRKKNGDVIVEVDHANSDTKTDTTVQSKTETQTMVSKTTVQTFMKNYSIEAMFPLDPLNPAALPNPLDTQISLGVRIFSLPAFAVIGTDGHFNKVLIGLRVEF